jgi:hypothetical protein
LQVDGIESCNVGEFATMVWGTLGTGSSSQQPFKTPENLIDAACGYASVFTSVTEAALDPLMHKLPQTPPLTITPTTVDTPPGESHTHVSYTWSP